MTAFLHDALWQEQEPEGHGSYPIYLTPAGASGLVWWLKCLQATLEDLYARSVARHDAALVTALVTSLSQYPEQADSLRNLLIRATEYGFISWDQIEASINQSERSSR